MANLYNKILIARNSPENKCFARDSAVLIVKPKKLTKDRGHIGHNFVDHHNTKSKYGWVKITEPFTLDQFITEHVGGSADMNVVEHITVMLDSIRKLPEGTPVAATYSERGVEQKRMQFTVHRVFFY